MQGADATGARPIKVRRGCATETDEIKEQGHLHGRPAYYDQGRQLVINGAERAIISQIVRSPRWRTTATKWTRPTSHLHHHREPLPWCLAGVRDRQFQRVLCGIDKNRKPPITCLLAWVVDTDEKIKDLFGEDERILATIEKDPCKTREESLLEIYRKLRPGEPPTVETAIEHLNGLLF